MGNSYGISSPLFDTLWCWARMKKSWMEWKFLVFPEDGPQNFVPCIWPPLFVSGINVYLQNVPRDDDDVKDSPSLPKRISNVMFETHSNKRSELETWAQKQRILMRRKRRTFHDSFLCLQRQEGTLISISTSLYRKHINSRKILPVS